MTYEILCGENTQIMKTMEDNTFDCVITDPPYGMEIAGMGWDKDVPPSETWQEVLRVLKPGGWCLSFCSPELYHRMASKMEDGGFVIRDQVIWMVTTKMAKANKLKPAHEPIAVAQKPISEKTIKANIEKWGTGTINTEGNRIPWDKEPPKGWVSGGASRRAFGGSVEKSINQNNKKVDANPNGRYPSNIVGLFEENGHQKYFYAPRVSKSERGEYNNHPTPKPVDLMRWLISVYTPSSESKILDPFNGSGSTGVAAIGLGHNFVGIDMSEEYCSIAEKRIQEALKSKGIENFFA